MTHSASPRNGPRLTLLASDPRWHAWITYDLQRTERALEAVRIRQFRQPYQADADWPPPTPPPQVEQLPLGNWSIAWGTPEHAAWLAAMRRQGPLGVRQALGADVGQRTLIQPSRWPLDALETAS